MPEDATPLPWHDREEALQSYEEGHCLTTEEWVSAILAGGGTKDE